MGKTKSRKKKKGGQLQTLTQKILLELWLKKRVVTERGKHPNANEKDVHNGCVGKKFRGFLRGWKGGGGKKSR